MCRMFISFGKSTSGSCFFFFFFFFPKKHLSCCYIQSQLQRVATESYFPRLNSLASGIHLKKHVLQPLFLCTWGQQGSEMLGTRLSVLSEPEAESRLRSSPLTPVRDSQNLRIGINFKPQVSFPAPGFSPVNQTVNRFILMLPNDDAFFFSLTFSMPPTFGLFPFYIWNPIYHDFKKFNK